MLLTTCPNCGAKFKVSPEQLNVRQGRVMCGRCRNVFNAFEALKRIQDAEAGEPIDYAVVDSRRAAEAPEAAPTEMPVPQTTASSDAASEEQPAVAPALHDDNLVTTSADEAFDSYEDALKKLAQFEELQSPHAEAMTPSEEPAVLADDVPHQSAVEEPSPVYDGSHQPAGPATEEGEQSTPSAESERYAAAINNPLISGAAPRRSAPSRTWGWLAAFAALGLALQATYYFRSQIVQQYPQLRPQLVAACEVIGCNVPWGRDQNAVKIESSDLIEPPGRPGRILLTATLVNRAASKQDFPFLEVKLTDANNAVLTSRVLMPAEYLGRIPGGEEGLAPNVELYINLNLEIAGKSQASGYGLQAFYP